MIKLFYFLVKKHSEVASKINNGKPFYLYWYSEIIFHLADFLSKFIRQNEMSKLDFKKIKKYYDMYGEEDTLKHFKLSEQTLNDILS